jgi:polyhydroxyalkanoate synthesis regulator phasin
MSTSKSAKKPIKKKDDGIIENVIGLVKKSVLAGLGLAFLTEEKIEGWSKKIAKDNKLSPNDIEKFLKDVKKESLQARKDVEKRLRDMLKEFTGSSEEKPSESSKGKSRSKKKRSRSRSRSVSSHKAKVIEPDTN